MNLPANELNSIKRGEVLRVAAHGRKGGESKSRYAVVVSADVVNEESPLLVVVALEPLPENRPISPHEIPISGAESGLPENRVACCTQINTIDKQKKVVERIAKLPESPLAAIGFQLFLILGGI